jgi:hypothetical protein
MSKDVQTWVSNRAKAERMSACEDFNLMDENYGEDQVERRPDVVDSAYVFALSEKALLAELDMATIGGCRVSEGSGRSAREADGRARAYLSINLRGSLKFS